MSSHYQLSRRRDVSVLGYGNGNERDKVIYFLGKPRVLYRSSGILADNPMESAQKSHHSICRWSKKASPLKYLGQAMI